MNHPFLVTLWMASLVGLCSPTVAQVQLDSPTGGWRSAPAQQKDFAQEVHYPAASVNTLGLSTPALIQGRIKNTLKAVADGPRQPARLIVDGIAIPLLSEPDGQFSRPWAFGRGSHSIEVRSPQGHSVRRQFFESQAGRIPTKLRIALSWDSDSTDVDLHVISPDGQHVFYGKRIAPNGGALDVDVTTGFGPEIFATPAPLHGVYQVFVNYYGAGDSQSELITAQVSIVRDEGTPSEKQEVFRVPLRRPGDLTLVRRFTMP